MSAVLLLVASLTLVSGGQAAPPKGSTAMQHAAGTFDVKITPQKDEGVGDATIGRMGIDKVYHGDLVGTGLGQMLAGMGEVKDSGAYVAIERVKGSVHGKTGSFAVHHLGVMDRGAQRLVITVIPDSGTGDLVGITGTMTIEIKGGAHYYTLDYTLP
jgi:hypothetical protein